MKESQGAICVDPAPLAVPPQEQSIVRSFPDPSRETGHSLLLLQLRTELEGKWRPDKFGILRKWMNASPKHWFCQKEDAYDYAVRPGIMMRNVKKRNGSRRVRAKKVGVFPKSKTAIMERLAHQVAPSQESEEFVDCRGDSEVVSEKTTRRSRRFKLEEEVMVLQKQLQKELDLHLALENAINLASGVRPQHPKDIPNSARELLEDIAALETVVAALEDKSIALQGRIGDERRERETLEKNGGNGSHFREESASSNPSKDIHVVQHSRQTPTSRRTKTPPKVQQSAERDIGSRPAMLHDRFRNTSIMSDAQPSSPSDHRSSSTSGDSEVFTPSSVSKPHRSETPRKVPLSWKSRGSDSTSSEESLSSTFSSDSISKHEFLSVLDSLKSGNFSAALQAEAAAMPSPFSPARISYSGASTSDQSGSLGPSSGREQEFGASSPLVLELYPLPTSPSTPEHRVRPSSPAHASIRQMNCDDGAMPSQDNPFSKMSRRKGESRDDGYSLNRRTKNSSFGHEEFFTPKTSISGFGDPPGDSQPSSIEKVRSRVRVKLNLQPEEKPKNAKEASPEKKSYDAEYVKHRNLWNELSPGVQLDILPPGGRSAANDFYGGRDYSKTPNLLSEEMMKCMIGIYWHLADPAVVPRNQSSFDSPTSHLGNTALSSSVSSFSEYSLMSFVRSPLVDLRTKDDILGCESSPDPYRTRGKIPWADIGLYGKVLEVPWMSVRTDQLGYATQALNKFRFLAEQLSEVDPLLMSHSQKLAFWLNLYNCLMMHAFLTYGIPRNDLKYFALLQKAAFNVGGHSFNAATIEHSLLKGKSPSYRPQLGLLMALHRNKWTLTDEQSKFSIDYTEPQMIFALCCGARSSPAVRVYTAAKVHKEINMALRDHARATVGLNSKGKLLVPKLLYSYAHDFVDDASILDWVCQFLPTNQAGLVRECWQHRQNRLLGTKSFVIMPFELNFRYLFTPIFDPSGDLY
ncbi:unnamed protein product [Calypogeia fissa]